MSKAQNGLRLAYPVAALLPVEPSVLELDPECVDVRELDREATEVGPVIVVGGARRGGGDRADVVGRPEVELQLRLGVGLAALQEVRIDRRDRRPPEGR